MEALPEGGVSVKQVKLKILYTFDSEHKNNHLARWPQSIEVQTAPIDENVVIGIINLRTCLEAVTTSSPELTSNIDSDYTVYAYDYSEPDTPLVGQGMLSRALLQEGEDQDNEAMVTGRITKNVMGLFSKNAQETLEVKLRLTPVSGGYTRKRSGSISSNADNVQQQWTSLSQTNGAFRPSSPMDTSGLETMQRMLSEGGPKSGNFQKDSFYTPTSRPTSRAGSPAQQSQQLHALGRNPISHSRPSSRMEAPQQPQHVRRDSFNSGYYSGEDTIDDGPRKRAKIQRVDWPSKSNFNIERQSDSLRVTASTASSLRLHRPVPQYPGIAALQNGSFEEPNRPPTPRPNEKPSRPRGRPRKVISPNLLRGPKARQSSPAPRAQDTPEVSLSSPEDARADSVTSTPADLPSSPPVMPEPPNFVTSPALPPMMNETDSGFMSGTLEDLFDDPILDFGDFLQDKPEGLNQQDFDVDPVAILNNHHQTEFGLVSDFEQPSVEMLPPSGKRDLVGRATLNRTASLDTGRRSLASTVRLAPNLASKGTQEYHNSRAQTALPQIPASDPVGRIFQRSNTWAPDMSDAIMSDVGPNVDDPSKSRPKKRVGKEQTKARLENAIAQGEMPPFCDNCGAIETPAWRRAFVKIFDTPYDDFQTSLEPGECCYKEPVERHGNGTIKLWKGYRTEKRPDEKSAEVGGWSQICLCNPCGLWFHKSKYPRPPEKWQKRDPNEKRKRKRRPKPKKKPSKPAKSDAPTPASEDSSPGDTANEDNGEDYGDDLTANEDGVEDNEPQLPPMPPRYRAGSAEPVARGLGCHNLKKAKGIRQVKSSPAGGPRAVLKQMERTPNTVRRQLFPSPDSLRNKAHAMATLSKGTHDSQLPAFVRRSPRLNKTRDIFATTQQASIMMTGDTAEKENVAPLADHDVYMDELFNIQDDDLMMPPMTPTPKRRSERLMSKTPGKTPSREFGAKLAVNALHTSPSMKTPKHKLHPAASILINTVQRNLDPCEMTPFTRSIHDALNSQQPLDLPMSPKALGSDRARHTPRKSPPGKSAFDFPDLPSLKGSSPLHGDSAYALNFSELTTDQLHTDYNQVFSTDMPMPSSPPAGYFNFLDIDNHDIDAIWEDMAGQTRKHEGDLQVEGDTDGVVGQVSSVRRSPRKHAV